MQIIIMSTTHEYDPYRAFFVWNGCKKDLSARIKEFLEKVKNDLGMNKSLIDSPDDIESDEYLEALKESVKAQVNGMGEEVPFLTCTDNSGEVFNITIRCFDVSPIRDGHLYQI